MADNQFAVFICPKEIFAHDAPVVRHSGQPPGAGVVAKFEIRQPDIEHAVQQFASLRRTVRVRFPNQSRRIRQRGHQFKCGVQMNCRFAAQYHDGARAVVQGAPGAPGHFLSVPTGAGSGIPA
jgi:hypothetical protein